MNVLFWFVFKVYEDNILPDVLQMVGWGLFCSI